jgi:hypothetical protein
MSSLLNIALLSTEIFKININNFSSGIGSAYIEKLFANWRSASHRLWTASKKVY